MNNWKYPTKLPRRKYWYHGTTLEGARQIQKDGVIKPGWYAVWLTSNDWAIHFAHQKAQTALAMKLLHKQSYDIFNYENFGVFKIPTSSLDHDKMHLSLDHAPKFFPGMVAMEYHGEIPVEDPAQYYIDTNIASNIRVEETA